MEDVSPNNGAPDPETVPPDPSISRRKLAIGVVILLIAIAALAGLVRSNDERARPAGNTEPTSTAIPAATPDPVREPSLSDTPKALPTPVTIPPRTNAQTVPTPASTAATAATANDSADHSAPPPLASQQWQIADGRFVAITAQGAWTANAQLRGPLFHAPPEGMLLSPLCSTQSGHDVMVVGTAAADGSESLLAFDVATRAWTTQSSFPMSGFDPPIEDVRFCAMYTDGDSVIMAGANVDGLHFLIAGADLDSATSRLVSFPDHWRGLGGYYGMSVTAVMSHDDEIVLTLCASQGLEEPCSSHLLALDRNVLLGGSEPELSWQAARGRGIEPTGDYVGDWIDTLAGFGLESDSIELRQVGDRVWHMERYNTLADAEEPAHGAPFRHGSWMAAPLGEPLAPFPRGLRPQLFALEDTAIAAVPLAIEPGAQGLVHARFDWFRYDRSQGSWLGLPASPVQSLSLLAVGPRLPFDGELFFDSEGLRGVVAATAPPPSAWDQAVSEGARPTLVGDRAYSLRNETVWISDDRGQSWSSAPYPQQRETASAPSCPHRTADHFVYTIRRLRMVEQIVLESPTEGRRVITLPRRATPFVGSHLPPCRPVQINGTWHFARIDLARGLLLIDSIDEADLLTERTIDITGDWLDSIPHRRSYLGSVSLYQDDDLVIAHICTVGYGAVCTYTDFSFHRSLLEPGSAPQRVVSNESTLSPPTFYPPNGHPFGAAEELFQVGEQLWRADHDEIAGECICGEGGDWAPYWNWAGGRFAGAAEIPTTRTVTYRQFAGAVIRCGSDAVPDSARVRDEPDFIEPDGRIRCDRLNNDGSWTEHLGPLSVDWATVPIGVDVTFDSRTRNGRIMVVPTGRF